MSLGEGSTQATEIIFCERLDIAQFIYVYKEYLRRQGTEVADSRIVNFQNMDQLEKTLARLWRREELQNFDRILVVADGAPQRRERELLLYRLGRREYLRDCPEFDYYLFPYKSAAGHWKPGYLEDVLLETLRETTAENSGYWHLRNIAADFLLSANNIRGRERRLINYNRHLLCSYFAGTEQYAGLKLAEAARLGAFALEDARFDLLQAFLVRSGNC